jgi:hypothetical protein
MAISVDKGMISQICPNSFCALGRSDRAVWWNWCFNADCNESAGAVAHLTMLEMHDADLFDTLVTLWDRNGAGNQTLLVIRPVYEIYIATKQERFNEQSEVIVRERIQTAGTIDSQTWGASSSILPQLPTMNYLAAHSMSQSYLISRGLDANVAKCHGSMVQLQEQRSPGDFRQRC